MDGVSDLRKRAQTRLWYRAMPAVPIALDQPAADPADDIAGPDPVASESNNATEEPAPVLPGQSVASPTGGATAPAHAESQPARRLGHGSERGQPADDVPGSHAVPVGDAQASDDWRTVPAAAPALLLSATDLLDARVLGPVLCPGSRYRVASVRNGVVGLDVAGSDGVARRGYCAAVDLICIDRRFAGFRPGRHRGARWASSMDSLKTRVQRIAEGLGQATVSLLG